MTKLALLAASIACLCACSSHRPTGTIVIETGRAPLNVIHPDRALGGAIDGLPAGQVESLFTKHNIAAIRTAGLRPISYSLRTELAIDAWHWGEEGSWSDAAHHQGYWVSSDDPKRPVMTGWGYMLPRRGDSVDQAEDDGYSRIDDGDARSFWKSNPYLDPRLSRSAERPQWIAVDFGRQQPISVAKINWAEPYATHFRIQYWTAVDPYDDEGRWRDFPNGDQPHGTGGVALLRLSQEPIKTEFVRILLERSSHRAAAGSHDIRDSLGFAVREVGFGTWRNGRFEDIVRHTPNGAAQTQITVSSTDPWHRQIDRDPNAEQPGFDRIFRSGLADGAPVVVPVGVLYDSPENAASEFRFLRRRGYPVRQAEMGEEPDGQNISPDDFAALYRRFAAAIRAVDPQIELGGPNLQDAVSDTWLDDTPDRSWTRRFLLAIRKPDGRPDLDFFTFEHYPYDTPCGRIDGKLVEAADILKNDLARLREDGVPTSIPWVITEYGFSAFSGRAEVELPGALFDAGLLARFFAAGGNAAYLLGYGPDQLYPPDQDCAGYGELMLFGEDARGQATWPTPTYWTMRLLTHEWLVPGDSANSLYPASLDGLTSEARRYVAAWPVLRPDGRWSVMLINRSANEPFSVNLALGVGSGGAQPLPEAWDGFQYDGGDYRWDPTGPDGHPLLDRPPRAVSGRSGEIRLPPYSITIVRFRQDQTASLASTLDVRSMAGLSLAAIAPGFAAFA